MIREYFSGVPLQKYMVSDERDPEKWTHSAVEMSLKLQKLPVFNY